MYRLKNACRRFSATLTTQLDKGEVINQRMAYEDSLKIAVQMLSRATPASELVKLLKLTSYLDR